jgi:DNA-binding transcriptional regulator YdaS (Cro superfamily)
MQLAWLQTFMAVYHTGSFTKAARQLGVTQPTVTQQIRSMELEIGHQLFERTTRGTVPTPRGTILAQDVRTSMIERGDRPPLRTHGHRPATAPGNDGRTGLDPGDPARGQPGGLRDRRARTDRLPWLRGHHVLSAV